ncbi:MAG: hypothetical protein V5A55_12370 [Halovenus sp.]
MEAEKIAVDRTNDTVLEASPTLPEPVYSLIPVAALAVGVVVRVS